MSHYPSTPSCQDTTSQSSLFIIRIGEMVSSQIGLELGASASQLKSNIINKTVGGVGFQIKVFAFGMSKSAANSADDNLDDAYILSFIKIANVINLGNLTIVEDYINVSLSFISLSFTLLTLQ